MSIFTVLFLPLNLVAGLMGMNVVLPTDGHTMGFWEIIAVIAVLAGVELWVFKKLKWI
jgi:magnesium transporter